MTMTFHEYTVFMNSYKQPDKPRRPRSEPPAPPMTAVRLLDQVRERIRYKHYSLRTEQQYVYWVRAFVRFHGLRHPREMGAPEVERFLSWLAAERKVAVSTHKQALAALLFLYRNVLDTDLPWLSEFERPKTPVRLSSVLSRDEVSAVLAAMEGPMADLASLVYGTGMRLMESLRLRVKDVDFERRLIVVREGKGKQGPGSNVARSLQRSLTSAIASGTSAVGAGSCGRCARRGNVGDVVAEVSSCGGILALVLGLAIANALGRPTLRHSKATPSV